MDPAAPRDASPAGRLIRVAVPAPTRRLFTYEAPPELAGAARPGVRVRVALGSRHVTGVVVGDGEPIPGVRIQTIEAVLDTDPVLPPSLLDLTRWVSQQYLVSWGAALRAALPSGLDVRARRIVALTGAGESAARGDDPALAFLLGRPDGVPEASARASLGAKGLRRRLEDGLVSLAERLAGARGERRVRVLEAVDPTPPGRPAPARDRLLARLRASGPLPAAAALSEAGVTSAVARRAIRSGFVIERWVAEDPSSGAAPEPSAASRPPTLTDEQRAAVEAIAVDLRRRAFAVHLLAGVTGSGKTEVYLAAASRVLAAGGRVLMLVPEIGLAPLLSRAVSSRFGDVAAVLHSGLAEDRRLAAWRRIRRGEARVVLGARSAVFAPLERIDLVVVDEEHDGAYKQEETPRYHGRDLAIVRASRDGATAVLGSATPSMESWERARQGRYHLSRLASRIGGRALPEVEFVDLREEFRETGADAPLSRRLVELLGETLERREQAIVLINRRGYSPFVLCRECGETAVCGSCEVSLTYHRTGERLRCHYCGYTRPRAETCDRCGSGHLHYGGEGTQRVERHLRRVAEGLRVVRLDRDTARGRQGAAALLARFERGEADVLVGTQMVAKGHDFHRVTLVGVLGADAALGMPDFRAAERTFQLVTQVAGRSGRGDRPGRVLVQAFRPGHPALRAAAAQDLDLFVERERRYRKALGYPPFSHLARVVVADGDAARARERALEVARLVRASGGGRINLLGPAPAPVARLRGRYRVHILARAAARGRLVSALGAMLDALSPSGTPPRGLLVDIDPLNLQ